MIEIVDTSYVMNNSLEFEQNVEHFTSPGVLREMRTFAKHGNLKKDYLRTIKRYNLSGYETGKRLFEYKNMAKKMYKETERWNSGRCEPLSDVDAELIAYALVIEELEGEQVELESNDKLLVETYELMRKMIFSNID